VTLVEMASPATSSPCSCFQEYGNSALVLNFAPHGFWSVFLCQSACAVAHSAPIGCTPIVGSLGTPKLPRKPMAFMVIVAMCGISLGQPNQIWDVATLRPSRDAKQICRNTGQEATSRT
jgi:hypothetical protein